MPYLLYKDMIEKIVKENASLINNNEFEEVYKNILVNGALGLVRNFTLILYEAGIDPLPYMTRIPSGFLFSSEITSIDIPSNIKVIGDYAFSGCNDLEAVTIPKQVEKIEESAFYMCEYLKKVTFESDSSLTDIYQDAFRTCKSLEGIYLPDKVERLGRTSFFKCGKLSYVSLPKNIKYIEEGAFNECPNLTEVRYRGTKESWKKVLIEGGIPVTIRCTDGLFLEEKK